MAADRPTKRSTEASAGGGIDSAGVVRWLRDREHPLTPALELVRATILGASPRIGEGIKWNCPSFCVVESMAWFATLNTHRTAQTPECVLIVFHQGAKVREDAAPLAIADASGLLTWLGKDRATVRFSDLKAARAGCDALQAIVQQWITQL